MIFFEDLKKLNESFFDQYKDKFAEKLNSGWFILGESVKSFESEFASYNSTKHCIGVASGLDALTMSLKAGGLEPGTGEVIVPSNTYIATILSILHAGLKPVLVEPDINTYNIDPSKIEEKITNKTKALMIVHLYGKPCEMDEIIRLKNKHNLILIEDTAQAHGAKYKNRLAGTFGEFGAFSFYPTKNLGALGDAGAVITNSDDFAKNLRRLRNYGSDVKYYNEIVGFNSRLDEMQADFLSIKLKALNEINHKKRRLARIYFDVLKEDFIKPNEHPDFFDVFHIFNVRHPKRNRLKDFLLNNGIKTEVHYPVAPHLQTAMLEIFKGGEYPISEEIHNTTLSLPLSFAHTEEEITFVAETMNKF